MNAYGTISSSSCILSPVKPGRRLLELASNHVGIHPFDKNSAVQQGAQQIEPILTDAGGAAWSVQAMAEDAALVMVAEAMDVLENARMVAARVMISGMAGYEGLHTIVGAGSGFDGADRSVVGHNLAWDTLLAEEVMIQRPAVTRNFEANKNDATANQGQIKGMVLNLNSVIADSQSDLESIDTAAKVDRKGTQKLSSTVAAIYAAGTLFALLASALMTRGMLTVLCSQK